MMFSFFTHVSDDEAGKERYSDGQGDSGNPGSSSIYRPDSLSITPRARETQPCQLQWKAVAAALEVLA